MSVKPEFTVRPAEHDDLPAVQVLFERFYAEEGFSEAVARVAVNLPQLLRREDTAIFVAETVDGRIVGASSMSTAFGLEAGSYAELEDIYVMAEYRGRGIAGIMVEHCMDWAAQRGCADVEIVVTPESPNRAELISWYTARGFRNTGRIILERDVSVDSREMYA